MSRSFDIFFSICQSEVNGVIPTEHEMFDHFFDQVKSADELGFGTAWIAETHLSSETQKKGPKPVIPNFVGEVGLNTDTFQLAHRIFSETRKINVGSAIRNILCNGGPIAHAEAARMFLAIHGRNLNESRTFQLGFASGRFEYCNRPYGIKPRNSIEEAGWPVVKGKIFREAVEIFLRLLRGDTISSEDVSPPVLTASDFRAVEDWKRVEEAFGKSASAIPMDRRWTFERLSLVPRQCNLSLLDLYIGSHDPATQRLANTLMPVGVFNLSITPGEEIEKTHERMKVDFNPSRGAWHRRRMPRTVMVFESMEEAKTNLSVYWKAMEGTIDPKRVDQAVHNALVGSPAEMKRQIESRFDPDERLMLWFDFNDHKNEHVKRKMATFMEKVAPCLN